MRTNNNQEIVSEMTQLLEKMAVETFAPMITEAASEDQNADAVLINLKAINARYDKQDAIAHVKALMAKYNIQIDEIVEQIRY